MSGRVHANPEDLKTLRRQIDRTRDDITSALKKLGSALQRADWDDKARRDFEAKLTDAMASIRKFDQSAQALRPILDRKIRELESFLR